MLCIFLFLILFTIEFLKDLWMVKKIHKYEGRVVAKIIRVRVHTCYDRIYTKINLYYPTYQYNVEGKNYEREFSQGYRGDFQRVGKEVVLCYDKKNPEKIVPRDEEEFWKKEARKGAILNFIFWGFFLYCLFTGKYW